MYRGTLPPSPSPSPRHANRHFPNHRSRVAIRGGEARNRYTRRYYPPPSFFLSRGKRDENRRDSSATRVATTLDPRAGDFRASPRSPAYRRLLAASFRSRDESGGRIREGEAGERTARAMDRDDKWDTHLLLQNDMLALPIFHHAESLQGADNVVRIDCHFFADIWKKIIGFILPDNESEIGDRQRPGNVI